MEGNVFTIFARAGVSGPAGAARDNSSSESHRQRLGIVMRAPWRDDPRGTADHTLPAENSIMKANRKNTR
jgi:hypothetical protein